MDFVVGQSFSRPIQCWLFARTEWGATGNAGLQKRPPADTWFAATIWMVANPEEVMIKPRSAHLHSNEWQSVYDPKPFFGWATIWLKVGQWTLGSRVLYTSLSRWMYECTRYAYGTITNLSRPGVKPKIFTSIISMVLVPVVRYYQYTVYCTV